MRRVVGCSFFLMLAVSGCSKSTVYWIEEAKARDAAKRLHAIHVLQEKVTEGATVVPVLIEALKDENTYVRRDAARALAKFGPEAKDAIPLLIASLKDREPSVKKAAAQSLKQIDAAAATKAGVR